MDAAEAEAAGAPQGFPVSMATAPDDVDDDVAHAAMTKIYHYVFLTDDTLSECQSVTDVLELSCC